MDEKATYSETEGKFINDQEAVRESKGEAKWGSRGLGLADAGRTE